MAGADVGIQLEQADSRVRTATESCEQRVIDAEIGEGASAGEDIMATKGSSARYDTMDGGY